MKKIYPNAIKVSP